MSASQHPRVSRAWIGLLVVAVVTAAMVGEFFGLSWKLFAPATRTITARFADAQQLAPGDPVRIHGVAVGSVQGVTLDPGGRSATVSMSVDTSDRLYADATATARWRTLLGGSFVVAIDPGSPSAGNLGRGPIPLQRTSNQVELDQITSVDQGAARAGLTTIPRQLALAFRDPVAPAGALSTLSAISPALASGFDAVRGLEPDVDLRVLISAGDATMRALDTPIALRNVVAGTATTLQTTADHQADIGATLGIAPATLAQTNSTLDALRTTLKIANPLLDRLLSPAGMVGPTISELRPTVSGATTLLHRARPLIGALRPAVTSLASAGQEALPLLDQLTPSIDRLAGTIFPYMNQIDPQTGVDAATAAGAWLEAIGPGSVGALDNSGRVIRFPAALSSNSLELPCQINLFDPGSPQLLACQSLNQALQDYFGYQPSRTAR